MEGKKDRFPYLVIAMALLLLEIFFFFFESDVFTFFTLNLQGRVPGCSFTVCRTEYLFQIRQNTTVPEVLSYRVFIRSSADWLLFFRALWNRLVQVLPPDSHSLPQCSACVSDSSGRPGYRLLQECPVPCAILSFVTGVSSVPPFSYGQSAVCYVVCWLERT